MNDRTKYQMTLVRQREEREMAAMKPIPYRITAALDMCGMYGPEVDRALGGEEPMADEWEAGVRVPTVEQVKLLAEMTGVTPGFFYRMPEAPGGLGFMCTSGGCEPVWVGPPPPVEPLANVVPIGARHTPPGPPDNQRGRTNG